MTNNIDKLITFAIENSGETFQSPRVLFGKGTKEEFTISAVDDENSQIIIKKEGSIDVPIEYPLIEAAIELISKEKVLSIENEENIEGPVSLHKYLKDWQMETNGQVLNISYVPYISDLIVLSEIASYGWAKTPKGNKFAALAMKGDKEKRILSQKVADQNDIRNKKENNSIKPLADRKKADVLITYTTRHGTTPDIAWAIGNSFHDIGINAVVKRIQDVEDVRPYKLVIIGTPIYNGDILPESVEFTRLHKSWLCKCSIAVFIIGESLRNKNDETIIECSKMADKIRDYVDIVDIGMFGGKIIPEYLPVMERLGSMFNKERFGDFRNWHEISEWSDKMKNYYLKL
ncbi:hypothetical protein F1737_02840 [Methanoplanus sp. FWC-SCC4]|uniref:Flavodoxin-like domain-containing protein n=1 Tax=Methanochimaera problematica TaxID=2609417 RepID=A0AA97FCU3_9EURY|nr:flavodoxin domain-containing protein [Methanoplanus sp. FWC-SCC4]WOF15698.1 hypothetical protein F1737_02840 [Methanoplanus sp. FWC-SCC4]